MADDFPNNATTPGVVSPGGTSGGNLETAGDIDWFATTLQAGLIYQFTISATTTTVNPTSLNVALKNSTGVVVAGRNGDGNHSGTQSITYTPTSSGTYYVQADAGFIFGYALGAYQLTESPLDEYTNTLATTGSIAPGQILGAGLQAVGDVDLLAISLTAGYNYQFTIAGTTTTVNPTSLNVALKNGTGVVVAGRVGDGNHSGTQSITYTPTSSGTYYVQADAGFIFGYALGGYQLSASPQDDYTANGATTGHLTGNSITGSLEAANDVDWISVSLTAGSTYGFTIAATTSTINPTGLSISLLNGTGATVANGNSTTKTVTFTPTSSGTYYLQATSNSGASLGTYTISSNTTGGGSGSGSGAASATLPVYRFFDSTTGTQFLTSSASERDSVLATRSDLKSEGIGLNATSSTDPNASAVYRFFDKVYGTHFFTSSSAERDTIQATRADLSYEGVGFYEYANQQSSTTPVYRFFDTNRGTHFFTSSASERANIIATRSDLTPEGVSFYAPT